MKHVHILPYQWIGGAFNIESRPFDTMDAVPYDLLTKSIKPEAKLTEITRNRSSPSWDSNQTSLSIDNAASAANEMFLIDSHEN